MAISGGRTLTHAQAVAWMVVATLLWSIAGIVSRHLEAARSFEVTFWRSAFNALALALMLSWMRRPLGLWRSLRDGGRPLWLSAACWCVMYTNFMLALTLTTVANVLITMALAPLFTALAARIALGHRLQPRMVAAIAAAGLGIAWMYGAQLRGGESRHVWGTLVALGVPVAAAINWTLLQHLAARPREKHPQAPGADMLSAVLLGALLSAAVTLPLSLPLRASLHDVSLLALLGVFQLAIPCLMAVAAARTLKAPEIALLSLLEVVFGVLWAWAGAGEAPGPATLGGGALVLGALAWAQLVALRQRPAWR